MATLIAYTVILYCIASSRYKAASSVDLLCLHFYRARINRNELHSWPKSYVTVSDLLCFHTVQYTDKLLLMLKTHPVLAV